MVSRVAGSLLARDTQATICSRRHTLKKDLTTVVHHVPAAEYFTQFDISLGYAKGNNPSAPAYERLSAAVVLNESSVALHGNISPTGDTHRVSGNGYGVP